MERWRFAGFKVRPLNLHPILNKLTAENFEQQADKILSVGITSSSVVHVIVQLIFQKAINEPKFTSLYAQLCSKLISNVPNFEVESSQSCCENEFRSRTYDFDDQIARQRCLGNLRFIAELGQYGIIPEKVLHSCIRELLSKRVQHPSASVTDSEKCSASEETGRKENKLKERTLAADMECLCLFLTAIGKFLDTPKAQNLMDQYFQRLKRILARASASSGISNEVHGGASSLDGTTSNSHGSMALKGHDAWVLPARIRFMIEDLVDLRENSWVPRRAGQKLETNKPRLLRAIRLEIFKESGTLVAPTPSERSAAQPDIPGSGYLGHSSASSSSSVNNDPPFISSLNSGTLKNNSFGVANSGINVSEAKGWLELARMGEELCRSSPRDLSLLNYGCHTNEKFNNTFSGRTLNTNNRRFLSNKNTDLQHSNTNSNNNNINPRSSTKTTDGMATWSNKVDKIEDDGETGWVRGVVGRSRHPATTSANGSISNSVPGSNANLPPRMLRKLAAEAAGNTVTVQGQFSDVKNLPSSTKPVSSDSNLSVNSNARFTPAQPIDRSVSLDVFEPTYLQKDKPSSTISTTNRSPKMQCWSNSQNLITANSNFVGSQPSALCLKPQSPFHSQHLTQVAEKVGFPSIQNAASQKSTHRKIDVNITTNSDVKTGSDVNSLRSNRSDHSSPLVISQLPNVPDENKRLATKLIDLLERPIDKKLIPSELLSSDFVGRINVDLFTIVVLHLCEEGSKSPLVSMEPADLAVLLTDCANILFSLDNRPLFNRETRKSNKPVKSIMPIAAVWASLFSRTLASTSIAYSKSKLASMTAVLIWNGQLNLSDLGDLLIGGKIHPLFLLVLQRLTLMIEEVTETSALSDSSNRVILGETSNERISSLVRLFINSGLKMTEMMPEGSRLNQSMLSLLEERNLTFLVPSLCFANELHRSLEHLGIQTEKWDDTLAASKFAEHFLSNAVDEIIESPDFILVCMPVVYEYIHHVGVVELMHSSSPELLKRERAAWNIIPSKLKSILRGSSELQLDALHALQLFWDSKGMPKGFLLRCFMNLYDCEFIEEDTFLAWKEEVNSIYPSKGQALFEVNRWLTWLETAEEEDEGELQKETSSEILVENSGFSIKDSDAAVIHELNKSSNMSIKDIMSPILQSSSVTLGS